MVGDGFRVHNFFPQLPVIGMTGMSPFFLMDYNSKWNLQPSCKIQDDTGEIPGY